tara:strand:+ start:305 stop:961 length:657 start_codon:yes stop_codon:yes gene_type:complete
MGKITISEPVKGEALTVTKLNETIDSWITESSNIDGENVHDQSLDNYNFADDSVRTIPSPSRAITHFVTTNNCVPMENVKAIWSSPTQHDFTKHDHILRVSFLVNVFNDAFDPYAYYTIETELVYTEMTSFFTGNHTPIPGSKRIIRYEGTQTSRVVYEETVSYCMHLNAIPELAGLTSSNLVIKLRCKFDTNKPAHLSGDYRAGIYQLFAEIETIKR